ncbi:alkaline phosphatase family protein [Streptomyces sp. PH10-H1]|uniref:alkaline phosphatase family protein n=1 Tax=Streptomyces sp. PH10-H1 TaxID=3046212 RepID=UPI0032D98F20
MAAVLSISLFAAPVGLSTSQAAGGAAHPATGVGSCTLKNWNPSADPGDAKDLPQGARPQGYKPDDYDCTGAKFAAPGVEFAKFPQPHDFRVGNQRPAGPAGTGGSAQTRAAAQAATNPLAPYFPPFTHIVVLYRENHTFDDYLGDCATTVQAGCKGSVQSTNHISSVPNLHALAKTYALMDTYSTGTQPPSGPNHWWLFSGQSSSSSQQQSYPAATGTQFDRFLKGGPNGTYPFIMNGDFYWMLNNGSGYWRNPATNAIEALPVNRPGTNIPEELNYNHYTCCGQNDPDQTIANDYLNFVSTNGLPTYSYVELFNDHPGTYQDIPTNDAVTKQVVDSIMNNATYKDNTLVVVTEDDTQNGSNGPDHISNTYRVPTVIVASPTYMKQHYVSHVAYTTDNVLAAMERVMEKVHPGVIDPNNTIGLSTFPMTTADQAGLGDPLEDLWLQGATPLSATASASPTSGNSPLGVSFAGTASGGSPPYSYSWNFGDGSATSTVQNPGHTYNSAGTYTATLTVTDGSSPAKTASSSVTVTASPIAGTPPGAPTGLTASAGNGQNSLSWTAPASNGGVSITSYKVYRGTSPGTETLLTSGGCSALGTVLSCTDTGLTNGQTYYYKVSAVNSLGEGAQSNEANATPTGGCAPRQLLGNPGFETGTASPWSASSGVISNSSTEPPHSGSWDAWLDGYGTTTTDTLSQSITLPTGCANYNVNFWLHIDTAETTTTKAYDTLSLQVLNSSGTVLSTLATYSNLNHNTGYAQRSFSLAPYAGQNITLKFTGKEDYRSQTSFVVDDTALNVS